MPEEFGDVSEGGGNSSEWNEQLLYAKQYFYWNVLSKNAQRTGDPFLWWKEVEVKLTHAIPILDEKYVKKLLVARKTINGRINQLRVSRKNITNPLTATNKGGEILDLIFEFETALDRYMNAKMPFLKMSQKYTMEEQFG